MEFIQKKRIKSENFFEVCYVLLYGNFFKSSLNLDEDAVRKYSHSFTNARRIIEIAATTEI